MGTSTSSSGDNHFGGHDFGGHDFAVLYFHGASSEPDSGPPDRLCDELGVRIVRHVRPGYASTTPMPSADLRAVADEAIAEAVELGLDRVVAMGWSGGGPYAMATGSLGRDTVCGVALLASWAPMDPPHRGLPIGVRVFMRAGRILSRRLLRWSLGLVGLRTIGHVDDVRRVSRPWGFDVAETARRLPVGVWHAIDDPEVPLDPWLAVADVDLRARPGADHVPSDAIWREALTWARQVAADS